MKPMRSIWKGHIRFSLVTIPIRIYNAVDTAQTIRFNQLHKDCNGRIGYNKTCKKCSQPVKGEEIVKGYAYEPDQYAVFEKEDLDKLKLKSTKVIEIAGFVDASEVNPMLFESPYFAGPDGEVASKTYGLLSGALKDSGKLGVGKVVLRDREDVVMIAPEGDGILLYRLRYPGELRSLKDVPLVETHKTDKEQLKLARSLVDSMATTFAKLDLTDTYGDAVREMIDAKIQGQEVVTVEEEDKPVIDIMTALKESIEKAKGGKKPMVKATGKTRTKKAAKTRAGGTKKAVAKAAKTRKRRAG